MPDWGDQVGDVGEERAHRRGGDRREGLVVVGGELQQVAAVGADGWRRVALSTSEVGCTAAPWWTA
jgi:hypothetical protein